MITVLLIVVTAGLTNLLQYKSSYDATAAIEAIEKIPLRIGIWKGHNVHLDEKVYEILDTKAITHRSYTSDLGKNVFVSIVHYAETKVDFHAPESCLGGSGIKAEKKVKTIIISSKSGKKDIDIAEMLIDDNGTKSLVYYFYKVGDFAGQNYIMMRMNIAFNKLSGGNTSGSLIRISTQINSEGKDQSSALLISFANELFPIIEQSL